jgi:hypothetical protein
MTPLLVLASLYAPPLHCGACSFNSGEAFIHTLPAESMPAGEWAMALRCDFQEFDSFSDAELLAHAGQGVFTHSIDRSLVLRAAATHALSDEWTVGADLPFVWNQDLREGVDNGGGPEVEANGDQSGLGDASLFAQWKFHEALAARCYTSLYFGTKLPTGRTDGTSGTGERLEPDHQPGSGSVDVFAGLAASKSFGTSTLAASVLYTLAGDGSQDSNLGDVLRVSAGWGWSAEAPPNEPIWRWMVELNGQWHEKMELSGATDPNSGGMQLFLAPGVRVSWSQHLNWFLSVGVPLVQNLDGVQSETSFRASTGIGFSL